jgi:hypothetical protein
MGQKLCVDDPKFFDTKMDVKDLSFTSLTSMTTDDIVNSRPARWTERHPNGNFCRHMFGMLRKGSGGGIVSAEPMGKWWACTPCDRHTAAMVKVFGFGWYLRGFSHDNDVFENLFSDPSQNKIMETVDLDLVMPDNKDKDKDHNLRARVTSVIVAGPICIRQETSAQSCEKRFVLQTKLDDLAGPTSQSK